MKLDPYQIDACNFARNQPDAAALLLGCGLGKTAISIRYIEQSIAEMESTGVLIVAPRRPALVVWPLELDKWAPWLRYEVLRGPTIAEQLRKKADIYIINYEILSYTTGPQDDRRPAGLVEELKKIHSSKWPFDQIIWDELTKMKTYNSKRLKAMAGVIRRMDKRVGLTGTAICSDYLDLWGQYFCLDAGKRLGDNYHRFKNRYFHLPNAYKKYDWHIRPGAKEEIEAKVADISIAMESEDHLDIPPCTFEIIETDLPVALRKEYEELERECLLVLDDDAEIMAVNAAVLCGKLLQFATGSIYFEDEEELARLKEKGVIPAKMPKGVSHVHDIKLKAAEKIIRRHMAAGEPVLVAYGYKHEAARFLELFPEAVHLKGGMSASKEQAIQKRWDAGEIPIILCHPASAGHGLNMQYGSHVALWLTPTYDFDLDHQINKRIDRRGQTHPTTIYRMVMRDTIDEAVLSRIETKAKKRDGFIKVLKRYRQEKELL